jgi:hypothetical protein
MEQVKHIKSEIEALSQEDFIQLREWIAEKDWQHWDAQIAEDSASGKLDFLREEAVAAKAKGKLKDL